MPDRLVITIFGTPIPQGRPRFQLRKCYAYDPPKSRKEKRRIRAEVAHYMRCNRIAMFTGALRVTLQFFLPIPKSFSKKRHAACDAGSILPTPKPDLDNLVKLVLDACNGVLYQDDSCVVDGVFSKRYSDNPRVVIMVECVSTVSK